ncbi:MAG TPA: glucose-6-phosphate dehydrogenase assembly protein OpcA [Actinocrinis sp.]|uniref:glucose-6-phosphate dehydrogenase assembly protein OpcA n=1 Tax=Actinocrinis sp. TaxID=1920516 RepID=UPI002DDCD4FF|nr:glucose-6-phosphate dehydrogenase assembly protein OpcA [Actinocrinis sp.]HEV2348118.1 glucose-6-phosphate dehydrogenase assembly protein OpcA [Actinocrinis sp.]
MIIDLTDTSSSKIGATLVQARRRAGSPTTGAVLTLIISTEERHHYDAMKAASRASREHPARIIVVVGRPEVARTRLDAEVRVGDETGPGEVIVLRLYGELSAHADSVVVPLLLPDVPVVTWWPDAGPDVPSNDPLGRFAARRITDAAEYHKPMDKLRARAAGYSPGDTDLAWTRLTPWRSMLAAALDQFPRKITGASVSGEEGNPSARILAVWLRQRLNVPVSRTADEGPGITGVELHTPDGPIALTRPDGELATLCVPGQPDRPVALKRRETAELIAEELRRLDPDDVYAKLLQDVDVPFTEPLKVAGPTVEKAAKEAAKLGEPKPVSTTDSTAGTDVKSADGSPAPRESA